MTDAPTYDQVLKETDQFIASLPSDVREYVIETPYGRGLAHPFYRLIGIEAMVSAGVFTAESIVDCIADRQAEFEKSCADGDFEGALFMIDKAYRAEYLLDLIERHGVSKLCPAIGSVWVDVENIHRDDEIWNDIWGAVIDGIGNTHEVMDEEDRAIFEALPDSLTIYRGFREDGGEYGWSWTLDKVKAEWFARRSAGVPMVASATIPKRVALAYFGGRNEAEIVMHPDQYANVTIEALGLIEEAA